MKRLLGLIILGWGVMVSTMGDAAEPGLKKAIFAGGCFWCMQPPYDQLEGVVSTTVGYTGGDIPNPTYEQVSGGSTGHLEAIQVVYDPAQVSYREILRVFWLSVDPTDPGGQFVDRGSQYHTAIFYFDEEQKMEAEASKKEIAASGPFKRPVVTPVLPAKTFYPAEEYHQRYYRKNTLHYKRYRAGSGRSDFLEQTWGKPADAH